jgi:hypothetical protein
MLSKNKPPNQSTVLVVGLARDCEKRLSASIERLQQAVKGFTKAAFLVIESDSSDATVAVCERLKKSDARFAYRSLGKLRSQFPKRTDRIARCRNEYLNEIEVNPAYQAADYVVVADLDGVNRDISSQALESCWLTQEPWDVCTGNQGDYYYDIFALRHPVWCPGDALAQKAALEPLFGRAAALDAAVLSKMVHIPPTSKMIEVDSAFSGLAVYKKELLQRGRYIGLTEQGDEICEHVLFHQGLKARGARIFINPAMITAATTSHAGQRKFFRTFRRKLFEKIKSL